MKSDSIESRKAVAAWFFLNGFVVASWVAHIPRLSNALGATPGVLGLTLLCMAIGAVLGMTVSPASVRRLGAGRTAWWAAAAFSLLLSLPLLSSSIPLLAGSLLLFGAANGVLGVAMNSAAADYERAVGRPVMSSFHGWFSIGMVTGVAGGVAALDSSAVCDAVWREWAARVGLDPTPILAVHHGRRPEETLRLTYPEHATGEAAGWLQARQVGWTDGLKPVGGAAALLDALGQTPWAVVTSASRALAEDRLRAVGLWRGGLLIGADDVSEGKPSPEGYLAAAKALGVNPADCVVVEDAPAGVEAGARAGMRVVAVTTTHPVEVLATPHVVRDLAGLSADRGKGGAIRLVLTG